MEILKVSAKSNPNSVAGALAGVLREKGGAEIQAIGAGALNQAIKATAHCQRFCRSQRDRSGMHSGLYGHPDRRRGKNGHKTADRTEMIHTVRMPDGFFMQNA